MTMSLNVDGDSYNTITSFSIEGDKYYFQSYYTSRGGWQVDIYDTDNNPATTEDATPLLCMGKMMPNSALTWKYSRETGLFDGEIVCMDMDSDGTDDVGVDNFGDGKQYQLVYFTEDEIETYSLSEWTNYGRT